MNENKTTFVCCVESGSLEAQTVRMVESLRRWGGQFADAPIVAVTPRFGPPLSHKTRRVFDELHVKHLCFHEKSRYSWNKFLNKLHALVAVEQCSSSEYICWLDSDILIVGEPDQLLLNEGEDFVACAADKNAGTTGPEDPMEPYWQKVCNTLGINIKDLPWVRTEEEGLLIRLYWNSGVFAYRRSTGFAKHYLQTFFQLLQSRIGSQASGIYFNDQVLLGLTMFKMQLSWRALPYSHNYCMCVGTYKDWYREDRLKAARIVHYHDAMWPAFWPEFIKCLNATHPQVADWLSSIGPMTNEAPLYSRGMGKILKSYRKNQESKYTESCKFI